MHLNSPRHASSLRRPLLEPTNPVENANYFRDPGLFLFLRSLLFDFFISCLNLPSFLFDFLYTRPGIIDAIPLPTGKLRWF